MCRYLERLGPERQQDGHDRFPNNAQGLQTRIRLRNESLFNRLGKDETASLTTNNTASCLSINRRFMDQRHCQGVIAASRKIEASWAFIK